MDLVKSMELAGRNLEWSLCPTGYYLPYHKMHVDSMYRAKVLFYDTSHNIGRWWDAMLRLEDATGFTISPKLEAKMLENTRWFFDNPDNLCFNPPELDKLVAPTFELHSLRENLMALWALVEFRGNQWAVEQGHRMLEAITRMSTPDGGWNIDQSDRFNRLGKPGSAERYRKPNVSSSGRLIEALVWYYETTRDPLAFELAERLASIHLEHSTNPDGSLNTSLSPGHTHSYLGTLRGLVLFGLMTNQPTYIDRVAATYRVMFPQMVKESGWCSHDILQEGRAEVTSLGDFAQIAMWLAEKAGHVDLLDDVERIVRARIMPSQITELPETELPTVLDRDRETSRLWGDEEYVNVGERIMGAYGGMQLEPHAGIRSTTDITAAVVHSHVDFYHNIVVPTDAGLMVHLHFDNDDERFRIRSERAEEAKLSVETKVDDSVFIRVPGWTPMNTVRLTVNGAKARVHMVGRYAYVAAQGGPSTIEMRYALPTKRTVETTEGIDFTLDWRGDEVVGICPNTDFFPFYPTIEGCEEEYKYSSLGTGR